MYKRMLQKDKMLDGYVNLCIFIFISIKENYEQIALFLFNNKRENII